MKIIATLIATLLVSIAHQSEACSLPPQRVIMQATVLNQLFKYDNELSQAIRDEAGRDELVQSLEMTQEGYVVTLTNECQLVARPKWQSSEHGGMCPRIVGFEVQKRNCAGAK